MHRTPVSVATAVAVALTVAACSGTGSTADTFNEADVRYAKDVISAHQRTLALAELATTKTTAPAVLEVTAGSNTEVRGEMAMLTGFMRSWGQPELPHFDPGQHAAEAEHPLIQGKPELAALADLEGNEFDRAFLLTTAAHNRTYVTQSRRQLETGYDKVVLALARSISAERSRANASIESAVVE